jgi:hypothetical protein
MMLITANIHMPVTGAANAVKATPWAQLDGERRFGSRNALVRRCVR